MHQVRNNWIRISLSYLIQIMLFLEPVYQPHLSPPPILGARENAKTWKRGIVEKAINTELKCTGCFKGACYNESNRGDVFFSFRQEGLFSFTGNPWMGSNSWLR
jgi:hypothetical protein